MLDDPKPKSQVEFSGLLLVNKPAGITSFDVIRKLRRQTGMRKIGHAGTLDPAASGLMMMLFGAACKQAASFSKLDKTYIAEITLGMVSTTGDKEGELQPRPVSAKPSLDQARQALARFTGEITQVPSAYSAIKINGQEAYKRVRRGESVEMPSRIVKIYDLRITHYEYPKLKIDARVSSGTYIRSLAEDVGDALNTGGYLSGLVRTEVGKFKLDEAVELDGVDASLLRSTIRKV